jgi:hypothetical protein
MVCWIGPWEDAWKVDASLLLEQELPMVVDCREGPGPSSWVAEARALGAFLCSCVHDQYMSMRHWNDVVHPMKIVRWSCQMNTGHIGAWKKQSHRCTYRSEGVSWSKINTHYHCPQFMLEPTKMACNFCSRCGLSVCISGREAIRSTRVLKFHTSRVIDETNGMIHSVRWTQRPDLQC